MTRKPFAIYAITKHGVAIGARLARELPGADLFVAEKFLAIAPGAKPLPLPMGPLLADTFTAYDCHVHVISVGAVVRMIAPLLKNKKVDPAIVCVDDASRFAICVLSGHVGRGNEFAERVARILDAQAVVTTASDALGTLTVDILGREIGFVLDDLDRNVTRASAAVVNGEPVLVMQDAGAIDWWPVDKALPASVAYATSLDGIDASKWGAILAITDRDVLAEHPAIGEVAVVYRPKSLVVGVGCDRGAPFDLVERGVLRALGEAKLSPKSVRALATIDKKADEEAFLELSKRYGWPLVTYTADRLDAVIAPSPSETVKRHVGTRGVAEPAALLASGATSLVVAKRVYTEEGAGRSMTIAIARAPFSPRDVSEVDAQRGELR